MTKISYILSEGGNEHSVELTVRDGVMSTAVNHDVPGINGERGGEMTCGTCHVDLSEQWNHRCSTYWTTAGRRVALAANSNSLPAATESPSLSMQAWAEP